MSFVVLGPEVSQGRTAEGNGDKGTVKKNSFRGQGLPQSDRPRTLGSLSPFPPEDGSRFSTRNGVGFQPPSRHVFRFDVRREGEDPSGLFVFSIFLLPTTILQWQVDVVLTHM
jgi:hypothetical protein